MTDRVLFQTGDDLSEQTLGESRAQQNSIDYVERGLDVSVDWVNDTVQLTEGLAFLKHQGRGYALVPDGRAGLALADPAGLNYVFLAFDPAGQDSIEIRIETGQTTAEPALLIAVADGTDETVEPRNRAPDGEFESVDTENLVHTPAENISQSLQSALSGGLAVADASGTMKSVNPANFSDDSAAVQSLVDWIETNHGSGAIHVPVLRPDGTEYTFPTQISDSNDMCPVSFYFHSEGTGQSADPPNFQVTINNGNQLLDLSGDLNTGEASQGLEVIGGDWNFNGNDTGLVRTRKVNGVKVYPRTAMSFIGDLVVFDSQSYEWKLDANLIIPKDSQTAKTARVVVLENSLATQGPDDGVVLPSFSLVGAHDVGFHNNATAGNIRLYGHWEGAHGRAEIDNPTGSVYMFGSVNSTATGAHGIYHDGYQALISPSVLGNTDGDGIHIGPGNPGPFKIETPTLTGSIIGDVINIESFDQGSTRSYIPYESTIRGSVTYPASWGNNLRYLDGWTKSREGTVTVPAAGSAVLSAYSGGPGMQSKANYWVATDPGVDVEIELIKRWNAVNSQHEYRVQETTGNASVDVSYVVLLRDK